MQYSRHVLTNSVRQELSLPAGKIKKIRTETRCLLEGGQVTARKLSQLLGKLQAATRAIPLERTASPNAPDLSGL